MVPTGALAFILLIASCSTALSLSACAARASAPTRATSTRYAGLASRLPPGPYTSLAGTASRTTVTRPLMLLSSIAQYTCLLARLLEINSEYVAEDTFTLLDWAYSLSYLTVFIDTLLDEPISSP